MVVKNQKQNVDRYLSRYNTRFVTKGYAQTYDISYEKIYNVIIKMTTIHRTIIVMIITKGWSLHQMNIKMYFYIKNCKKYTHGTTIKLCGPNTF